MTAAANFKLLGSCYKNIFDDIFCLSWVHNVESRVLIAEKMGLKLRKFAEIWESGQNVETIWKCVLNVWKSAKRWENMGKYE